MSVFIRLNDLEDKIVRRPTGSRRPVIRWSKNVRKFRDVRNSLILSPLFFLLAFFVGGLFHSASLFAPFFTIAALSAMPMGDLIDSSGKVNVDGLAKTEGALRPLLGKDPHLTLRTAAFLTVNAMPEWLKKQIKYVPSIDILKHDLEHRMEYEARFANRGHREMGRDERRRERRRIFHEFNGLIMMGTGPGADEDCLWIQRRMVDEACSVILRGQEELERESDGKPPVAPKRESLITEEPYSRLNEKPYSSERAGLDYLDLTTRIENGLDTGREGYLRKALPSLDYRLPSSLKDAVVEIILFLSSLPESGEKPREDVVKTVMDTIDSLAIIDGKSFTATLRRAKAEAVREKDDAYNGAILDAADAARDRLSAKNDEGYKIIARGMDRMDKLSRASVPAIEAADSRREWAPSASCSI